ncbi:MAG: PadR family transcriptional regulator [Kordiimonadaceae bacterium]|nr:PadR family transcriptional regulator [Kordiimonadaceae bacterium]MBO6567527.1 PadR family transcriptional regulator [Kordiimonadaceae bacterium]MBO6963259.1 PadR family transcriptional regulator [Kordiimonadaceae bacterium]
MALKYALLVSLSEASKSGYDVTKDFEENFGFFWRAKSSQVYRELEKLKECGFVHEAEMKHSDQLNRAVYVITDAGREALFEWSKEPSETGVLTDDLLIQLHGIEYVDLDSVRQNLLRRREMHQDLFIQLEKKYNQLKNCQGLAAAGKMVALDTAVRFQRESIAICDNALKTLIPESDGDAANVIPLNRDDPDTD